MNRKLGPRWLLAGLAALAIAATACGSTPSSSGSKGNVTVAGFNFAESSIMAELYAQALEHDGYTVTRKLRLGTREVVAPAIKSGQIDLYPGYAATDLEYYNSGAGEASGDVNATVQKLNARLQPLGLEALTPSDGPATRAAFANGTIQVGLVFSSDSDLNKLGLVVLQDDKHLENADNVVPIIRTKVATDEVKSVLNKISASLDTKTLVTLNGQVELNHQDPDAVARAFLQQHNFFA